MTAVVVLPPCPPEIARQLAGIVGDIHEVVPSDGPADALAARVCSAITALAPRPPLIVVAHGSGALLLPSVARAQRSAHRLVVEYLLVQPELPVVSDTWPDAPVTVMTDDPWVSTQARLRGWEELGTVDLTQWRPRLADG